MKFWIIDIEKEFYSEGLTKPVVIPGLLGYLALWVFLLFFLLTRGSSDFSPSLMGFSYLGISLLIFLATYCELRQKIALSCIVPRFPEENDQEQRLSSNIAIPELEQGKNRTEFTRNSLETSTPSQNRITWNLVIGTLSTVLTLTTHSFFYAYTISCVIPMEYHIIFMVNIAFPVTVCLVCLSLISANILYNLWADIDFAVDYLRKREFQRLLLNVYVRIGWVFLIFAFIAALFSSFCGTIQGDRDSAIVLAVWACLISLVVLAKVVKKYHQKIIKYFTPKNS